MAVAIGHIDRSMNGAGPVRTPSLEELSQLLQRALAPTSLASLIDVRKDELVAIVVRRQDICKQDICKQDICKQETSRQVTLALRANSSELKTCCIGVSMDASDIPALPQAFQEAARAVEFIGANRPVMHFGDIDLMEFLVRHPNAAAQRLIPDWAGRLCKADVDKSGELSRTIRQFAASDLNVKRTARDLNLHTNTVYFRLNSVRKLTGINPRSYTGLSLLLTTLQMLEARTQARRQ
jgi:sugar diacid utilization regulator